MVEKNLEKFDQVTVLFSDIVEFTSIAAACNPLDVVNMLNNLYHKFDVQTNEYGVYKVGNGTIKLCHKKGKLIQSISREVKSLSVV